MVTEIIPKYKIMETITNHLSDEFEEECNGVIEYLDLSDAFANAKDTANSKALLAIAYDEYTHAKWIEKYLTDSNIKLTEEHKSLRDKAYEAISKHLH